MSDLDFFVDLMITGTVLGMDHTSDCPSVERVLGRDSTFKAPYGMLSDFGLVEFGWQGDGPPEDWSVTYFGAQVHRLPWLTRKPRKKQVGAPLVDRYGRFRPGLDLDELRAATEARGFPLVQSHSWSAGVVEYVEPTSRMGLVAVSDPEEARQGAPAGAVLKMLGAGTDSSAWMRFRGQEDAFEGYTAQLLPLTEAERIDWLDEHQPEAGPDRGLWWSYLRGVVRQRTGETSAETVTWRRLGFALDRFADERGVDTPGEAALALVEALLRGHGAGLADELHSMDDAVRRWLDAAPATFEEATRLCTDRPLDAAEIRLSRRLRNRLHDLTPAVPHLGSAAVAEELRAWVALKPELLRLPVSDLVSD